MGDSSRQALIFINLEISLYLKSNDLVLISLQGL